MNNDYFQRDDQVARINEDGMIETDTSTLEKSIRENAAGPKTVSSEVGSVTQHSIREQMEADKYLKKQRAAKSPGLGIRFTKLQLPGTAD
jgi:hypothetical protein